MSTKITLPLPTSINRTYRSGSGHFYKSQEAKDWEEEANYAWYKQRSFFKKLTLDDVRLDIVFFLKRDRDIDSGLKIVFDFMQNKIYKNDKQIKELHVIKVKSDTPRCEISII